MLAGLGTPDLRGTQGSFSFYSDGAAENFDISDGVFESLQPLGDDRYRGRIKGPGHPFRKGNPPLEIPFTLKRDRGARSVEIEVGKEKFILEQNRLSHWVKLDFKAGMIGVAGIAQWVLEEVEPLKLYLSPINIDPEKPSMPVSHPKIFSVYLAKLLGSFATLGMAEDTWSLNERVLSETNFIDQVYRTQEERERNLLQHPGQDQGRAGRAGLRDHGPHSAHVLALPAEFGLAGAAPQPGPQGDRLHPGELSEHGCLPGETL